MEFENNFKDINERKYAHVWIDNLLLAGIMVKEGYGIAQDYATQKN